VELDISFTCLWVLGILSKAVLEDGTATNQRDNYAQKGHPCGIPPNLIDSSGALWLVGARHPNMPQSALIKSKMDN
jgi:hypothetical protein